MKMCWSDKHLGLLGYLGALLLLGACDSPAGGGRTAVQQTELRLAEEEPAALPTPESLIRDWSLRSVAVAVVEVQDGTAFRTSEPPFIATRLGLGVKQVLAGKPPESVVVGGGVLGTETAAESEAPRLERGRSYLAFFWPGPRIVFAPAMSDEAHASLLGRPYPLTAVRAALATARSAGAL